jgi:hypothetical protein
MNKGQKWVLAGFILVVVVMFLFPPFQDGPEDMGYHFILIDRDWKVNVTMLAAQLIEVLIAGVIAYFAVRGDK